MANSPKGKENPLTDRGALEGIWPQESSLGGTDSFSGSLEAKVSDAEANNNGIGRGLSGLTREKNSGDGAPLFPSPLAAASSPEGALRFRLNQNGEVAAQRVNPEGIDPGHIIEQDLGEITLSELSFTEGVALAVSDEVAVAEVEALAVSCSEATRWEAPGLLQLKQDTYLRGPYRLGEDSKNAMKLPRRYDRVFLVEMPRRRAGNLAAELKGTDPLSDIFAAAQPDLEEWEVLRWLEAMARRLGGILWCGVAGESKTLAPDPDSAVTMTLYSPVGLGSETLAALLMNLGCSLEQENETALRRNETKPQVKKLLQNLFTPEELKQIELEGQAYDEFMLNHPGERAVYELIAEVSQGQHISVQAYALERTQLPPVLRWHDFPEESVAVFRLSWLEETRKVNRSMRLRRLLLSEMIEKIALALREITGGVLLDADAFLL